MDPTLKIQAQQYFQGVYCGQPAAVMDRVDEEIVLSYPIFQQLFGASVLRGLKALEHFMADFSGSWTEGEVTFHETIAEDRKVVLVWSFTARRIETNQVHHWGGVTLIRFNEAGKVIAEIGEESTPGPIARVKSAL